MKDGRFENADELRVWLDRKPGPKVNGQLSKPAPKVVHDCPKCHGAGHYIEECKTPGWRMVDCECAK